MQARIGETQRAFFAQQPRKYLQLVEAMKHRKTKLLTSSVRLSELFMKHRFSNVNIRVKWFMHHARM